MFIYTNGKFEKLDVNFRVNYDYLVDIRSNFERVLCNSNDWVHFPFRLIREGKMLPQHINFHGKLYIFNGCPYGIISRRAVDCLTNMGYYNCFTLTSDARMF